MQRNILGRCFFIEKIRIIFFVFQNLSKIFSDFWRKTFCSFVPTTFYVYKGKFWWFLVEKQNFVSSFSDFICKKLSNYWLKFFGKLVKIAIWVSKKNILRNLFPEKKQRNLFSGFERKKNRISAGRISPICQNCNLRVQGNNLRKNNNFQIKYMFLLVVFGLPGNFFKNFVKKNVSTVVQTAFYESRRRVWKKNIFFWGKLNFLFTLVTLARNCDFGKQIQHLRQIRILVVQRNVLRKKLFFLKRNFYSIIFEIWPKSFSASWQETLWHGIQNWNLPVPRNVLNNFF